MKNLTLKQKIILGGIITIMLIIISIYGYKSLNQDEEVIILGEILNDEEMVNSQNDDNQLNSETINNEENMLNVYENLEGKIIVHITGAVKTTGIIILPEGARIADAIDKAGGLTKEADLDEVNLAYELEDGQKVYIPSVQDKADEGNKVYVTDGSGNNVIVENQNSSNVINKKVNINTATQSELENLPGIGESIATRIIQYRKQNGRFETIEDLKNVSGIGDAKFENIKEYILVK